jgi:uncharacterized protein
MPTSRTTTELETYSGAFVDLLNPGLEDIRLEDIAVHLSNTARFAGGLTKFYSVAEHAVRVSHMVPPELGLAALHHDSHEYLLGDIPRPLKNVLDREAPGVLDRLAWQLDVAIGNALHVSVEEMHSADVKRADEAAMFHEAAALKWSHGVGPHWNNTHQYEPWAGIGWSPSRAERKFVERHQELVIALHSDPWGTY